MTMKQVAAGLIAVLVCIGLGPGARTLAAQDSTAVAADTTPARDTTFVVDKVVAVVGNRPVLASQVDEEIFSRQSQGAKLPTDPAGLQSVRQEIVSSIIDEELLLQQAQRDTSIHVTDEEIAKGVDEQVKKVRTNFTSEVDYAAELKKAGFQTPEEYRRWLTDQQRRAAYQNRLVEKLRNEGKLKPVSPTEKEMKQFFDEQKGSLGTRPATISFRQVVITPRPRRPPRPRPGPRPTPSCWSCAGEPTSPPPRAGSPRTPGRKIRVVRSTGSAAG